MPLEFVDTNIVLYAHDGGAGAKHEASSALLTRLIQESAGAVSTQILIEFYAAATKKLGRRQEEAAGIVSDFGSWVVHRLAHADVVTATRLHQRYKIAWWDALMLHSAQALGCSVLWTEICPTATVTDR